MKQILHSVLSVCLIFCMIAASAQVTKLSNNTSIQYGIQLINKFILTDTAGRLWTTNGTAVGTTVFTTKVVYDSAGSIGIYKDRLYFSGFTAGLGIELWSTNGTDAGTSLLKDIVTGTASSTPADFFVFNNILFFTATNGDGKELWKTDGTAGGTVIVKDINPSGDGVTDPRFFSNNNILFFVANNGTNGDELWKTDGTSGGTVMVKDLVAGSAGSSFVDFGALGTKTIFAITKGDIFTGSEQIWQTDGTTIGTTLLKDIGAGSALGVPGFLNFDSKLFFAAGPSFSGTGIELWSTDGTEVGTAIVKNINTSNGASSFPLLLDAIIINGKFYFQATTGAGGKNSELWESDGTETGTVLFDDINPGGNGSLPFILPAINYSGSDAGLSHTILYNGKIFFTANNGTNGTELWITDGTTANTNMVKDIQTGSGSGMGQLTSWFYTNAGLFFAANNGTTGYELWKSTGTLDGTNIYKDVNPGSGASDPILIGIYDNHLYFTANDGDNNDGFRDLFIIDATLGTLPLNLLSLTAAVKTEAVQLDWTTVNEINSSKFVVQRSINGIDFSGIGTVSAKGTNSGTFNYSFTDAAVVKTGASTLYYRLQLVDKDGAFTYSKIVPVTLQPYTGAIKVYPNPVKDQLFMLCNLQNTTKASLRITDASGKTIYTQQINTTLNNSGVSVNVAALSKGIYYVQIVTDKGTQKTQFIKQ